MRRRCFFLLGSLGVLLAFIITLPAVLLFGPHALTDYAYRELAYRVIADDVTRDVRGDVQMAEALTVFVSTHEYQTAEVEDRTVLDDLVRGLGSCDQQAWALSTLLAKEGVPSTLLMLRGRSPVSHHTIASTYLGGKWRVIDPYYGLMFRTPSGELATFEDIQTNPLLIRVNEKVLAIRRFDRRFVRDYGRLFDRRNPPIRWKPLTDNRDLKRRLVARALDVYVGVFGQRFAARFQDVYLWRTLHETPDTAMYLRARHYDLFFRRDLARATYEELLAKYPESLHIEDAMYFLGRLYVDLNQSKAGSTLFGRLLVRADHTKWFDVVHYFNGVAKESEFDRQGAIEEYRFSASDPQVDSSLRLLEVADAARQRDARVRARRFRRTPRGTREARSRFAAIF